jgi:phage terminase large subunit
MGSKLLEQNLGTLIDSYRNYPENYFRDRLNVSNLWAGELAILEAIPKALKEKKNIVVASGHSLGKDFTCGGIVPYLLESWGPCIVITTAPTDRQVQKIMWGEISAAYGRAKIRPPGELLTQEIKISPDWYALGFTTKETGNAIGKFQGFHSSRVFVIVSEAQAVADNVYEQIDAILTGQIGLLIQIGNPLRSSGYFANSIRNKSGTNIVITLSCLDNPNYLEKRQVVPGLCSYEWVEKKRADWGEDDPRWSARVLGRIPATSIDTVFSPEIIEHITNRDTKEVRVFKGTAVDVGRQGDDESVIYGGTNGKIEAQDIYSNVHTDVTASRAAIVNSKIGGNFIVIDSDGLGVGTYDTLFSMELKGVTLIELHSATKEGVDPQYENLRAQMWFIAKKRAEEGNASIPNDPMLIEELLEVKYFINKRGKIQIELKEEVKERLGRSPNRADAWIYYQYGMSQAEPIKHTDVWTGEKGSSRVGINNTAGAMAA